MMKHTPLRHLAIAIFVTVSFAACSSTQDVANWHDIRNYPQIEVLEEVDGVASYYHNKFHGRRTANGERYNKREMTAAHRDYPFGTYVRVTSLESGNSIIVRINDRGPRIRSRTIDLSLAAATELDMIRRGLERVRIEVLSWGDS